MIPDPTGERELALQHLRQRGVTAPEHILQHATPQTILETCRWYDTQTNAGVGLLVWQIKHGGAKPPPPRHPDNQYSESVWAWLRTNLPDLVDEDGTPHYRAFIAVTRLHQLHGKGSITVKEHGDQIRRYVAQEDNQKGAA